MAAVLLIASALLSLTVLGYLLYPADRPQETASSAEEAARTAPDGDRSNAVEYRFGIVPQFEPRHLAEIWVPILDELESRTGFRLAMSGSPRIPDFEVDFQQGRFDFAYMNPYHSLVAFETQGYEPLVRDGGRSLSGILVVAKDSPLTSVQQLAGKAIAFPAPNALGASLLMRADLETIHGIKVQPRYVKTHSSVYTEVLLGRADAGGGVMATLNQQSAEARSALRILYRTREMAPHPVVAHPRVPEAHREAVRRAFLELGDSEVGRELLAEVPIRKVSAAAIADYQPMKEWQLDRFFVPTQ